MGTNPFTSLIRQLKTAFAIRAFLHHTLTPDDGRTMTLRLLQQRQTSFLSVLRHAVYENPDSSYLKMLRWAGIEYEQVESDVAAVGLEAALEKLYEAGIYVTVDEFKGRAGIQREGLNIPLAEMNLWNPLAGDRIEARSGGSRGAPAYEQRTFDRLVVDAGSNAFFFQARGWLERPWAEWRQGDMYWPIFYGKFAKRLTRSFSTLDFSLRSLGLRAYLKDRLTRYAARLLGIPVKTPEFVPPEEAWRIAEWLAHQKSRGTPAMIHVFSSSALRICQAAQVKGLDIAGTAMAVTGEPFTPAKAAFIKQIGVEVDTKYTAVEFGSLGRGCSAAEEVDEVHLNADKVALIQRERLAPGGGVGGLFFTGMIPHFPKVMLNLEIGDYATVTQRDCGCPAQKLGLTTHLSNIRSYEKLTSEGVTFLGGELITLLEETLPSRFGGSLGDYQLVEEEDDGVSKVSILVAPSVGEIDEAAVVATVLEALSADSFAGRRRMGELWQSGNVLRVTRREPMRTGRAKVLPLHSMAASRLVVESGATEVTSPPAGT